MAISQELSNLTRYLRRNTPATPQEMESFLSQAGLKPPEDYLQFMQQSNGAYGEGELLVFLHSFEEALKETKELEAPKGMIFFGSDGGSSVYAFDGRGSKVKILRLSIIGQEVTGKLGSTFTEMLAKLRKEWEKLEQAMEKRSKLPPMQRPASSDEPGEIARLMPVPMGNFYISSAKFTADASMLVLGGGGGGIRCIQLWPTAGWVKRLQMNAPEDVSTPSEVFPMPSGAILSLHSEHLVRWEPASGQVKTRPIQLPGRLSGGKFLAGGSKAVLSIEEHGLELWNVDPLRKLLTFQDTRCFQPVISPDERFVATYSDCIQVHDLVTGKLHCEFPKKNPSLTGLSFSSDGRLVAGTAIGVYAMDVARKKIVRDIDVYCIGMATVPGSDRVVVSTPEKMVLYEGEEPVHSFDAFTKDIVPTTIFSDPSGRWCITCHNRSLGAAMYERVARVWRLPRQKG